MEKRQFVADIDLPIDPEQAQILVLSPANNELDLSRVQLPNCRVTALKSLALAAPQLVGISRARVLLFDTDSYSEKKLLADLHSFKSEFKEVAIVLLAKQMNFEVFSQLVNQGFCFRILKGLVNDLDLQRALIESLRHSEELIQQRRVLREVTNKNRELERLTRDLEKIVAERTYHIEISKQEIENKTSKMKGSLRFIKAAGSCETLDELAQLIRQEIRKFHKVGDPLLTYSSESSGRFALFFHQGNIIERRVREGLSVSLIELGDDSRHYVAGLLNRPVAQLLSITLIDEVANLFVEHSLNQEEILDLEQFITDRLQPIRMATERLLVSEQVATASYRWEKTFDGIRDPICIFDSQATLIHSNTGFNEAFGKKFDIRNELSEEEAQSVDFAFEKGLPQNGHLTFKGRHYEVHSYPISISKDGKVNNVVSYFTDVTAKRRLYSRMIQNEKMGAIGLLAGNIAHELNNPLTGIRSLAQTLKLGSNAEELNQDLFEIEKAAHRSQKVIKNLLDFSKGQGTLELVSVDATVEKTLPMLKTALRLNRFFQDLNCPDENILVEPTLLQQVVFNLINNACQAMSVPGEIRLKTERRGDRICLIVSDTGPGIADSQMEKIFEPFYTTKKEGAGTGLGLSMSKSVIVNFGGTIEVQSQLGAGTTFTVCLPMQKEKS